MPKRPGSDGRGSDKSVPVEAVIHRKSKRTNIPTSELGAFVADAERDPTKVLYPRDPSLDPQLVWKGKDEQDSQPLGVPAVPIYIQEKIAPRAIIEDLRAETRRGQAQVDLFSDFNGIPFEELVNFYQHKQNWSNRMILGDSLLVMTSLAEKEGLKGQVQCVYVDPPYGIKFGSNWQVSTRKRQVADGRAHDATRQPEQIKAFRDTWALGIHSYLAYLRDRLTAIRELLTPTGSVFVQIGDDNVHLVRCVMDDVFGSDCQVVTIVVKKKGSQKSSLVDPVNDYLLWYSKTARDEQGSAGVKFRPLLEPRKLDGDTLAEFNRVELDGQVHPISKVPEQDGATTDYRASPDLLLTRHPGARVFRPWPITNGGERRNQMGSIDVDGQAYLPPNGRCWSHTTSSDDGTLPGMARVQIARRLIPGDEALDFKRYLDDFPFKTRSNWWDGLGGAPHQVYVVQTNVEIVKRCILMTTDPGDLVLDPTCGSGTTAFVAEQWGRRWIAVDTSRVALTLARARLMSARYPQYLLEDSPEGARRIAEGGGITRGADHRFTYDVSRGFVYRTAPHITSGSIANNPEISEGMSPEDIDAAVLRHAERETLYDQPYEERRVVRVSGPFTVESLSPHRMISATERSVTDDSPPDGLSNDGKFAEILLANLRVSGVQNTVKNERLAFQSLEPWSGEYIQAAADYDEGGAQRRAAICIGPEHGTVGPELVRGAAKEASRYFDLLVLCGFAFDARVGEESRQMGRLTVLKAAINPDLQFGGEILKKSGSANLFTVFGEPDIDLRHEAQGLVAEIRGVDVYDPTSGEIRSNSTEDIACWFIDTDYNEESFFVRHAYFTGKNDQYAQLKHALRAEVDEHAWASLNRTVSRPFPPPSTGRIAVKVINHYGDEVMKVYDASAAVARMSPYRTAVKSELLAADAPDGELPNNAG